VQKIIAITLIGVFALSQYAKQLIYIECKISNNFKQESAKCDCETKLAQDISESPDQPANTTHFHVHANDVYFIEEHSVNNQLFASLNKLNDRYLNFECEGYTNLPLQPPRS
jgi:hypothetical protein